MPILQTGLYIRGKVYHFVLKILTKLCFTLNKISLIIFIYTLVSRLKSFDKYLLNQCNKIDVFLVFDEYFL